MPRVPRIHIENALYYVTSRGDHDEELFRDGSDYTMYIDLINKCREQNKFRLFAFCLLPNHIHLLIEPEGDTTIPQIMHNLNSNYTKGFNGKYNRKGHLFQERYKMVLIEKEPNLLKMTAFIHLNPRELKISTGAGEYPYSSYRAYLNSTKGSGRDVNAQIDISGEIKEALRHLKDKGYQDFIAAIPKEEIDTLSNDLNKKAVLGSDEFIEMVKSRVESDKLKQDLVLRADIMKSPITKRFIVGGSAAVLILSVLAFYLYVRAVRIRENYNKEIVAQDLEMNKRLMQEKQKIYKGLSERYHADMVSYNAMGKRLEIEKNRIKELESKLNAKEVKK